MLTHHSVGGIYLDAAAGVTTFLLAGRYFEAWSKRRSGNALRALADLGAKDVGVMIDTNGFEHRRSVAELDVGDRFIVRPSDQRKRPPQMAKSSLANRRWTAAS